MAHVSTKLLRETYQAFAGGDLEPLLGALTDDISWHDSRLGPLAGHCTGKDQVLGLFAKMTEVYGETLRLEVAGIFADDDRGVVLTREAATAEGEQLAWTSAVGDLAVSRRAHPCSRRYSSMTWTILRLRGVSAGWPPWLGRFALVIIRPPP